MSPFAARVTLLVLVLATGPTGLSGLQAPAASWLDAPVPAGWNTPGAPIPAAPAPDGAADPRCTSTARPPQLEEDRKVRERGWDLVGAFQGGWQTVVVRATAGYDGMCRPMRHQAFVFVRGVFAGTLSPNPMESRIDGSPGDVTLTGATRLVAEYHRYTKADPLCCPSGTTTVTLEIAPEGSPNGPIVRPVSASTQRSPAPK